MPTTPAKPITFHFPASFYKQISIDVYNNAFGNILVNTAYDIEAVDYVADHTDTKKDTGRIIWQFGKGQPKSYGKSDEALTDFENVYTTMCADAKLQGVSLSRNDARALIAFNGSVDKTILQGGVFHVGIMMLKFFLDQIQAGYEQNQIEESLTVTKDAENNLQITSKITGPLTQSNVFTLSPQNGLYTLNLQKEVVEFNKHYWERQVLIQLDKLLSKTVALDTKNLYLFIPFLGEDKIRKKFAPLLKTAAPDINQTAGEYIALCFEKDVTLREKIIRDLKLLTIAPTKTLVAEPAPAVIPTPVAPSPIEATVQIPEATQVDAGLPKKLVLEPEVLFNIAEDKLKQLIDSPGIDATLRLQASQLHTSVMSLSEKERHKNLVLLTQVMEGACHVINKPSEDTISHYKALMVPVINNKWRNIAIGMAAIIIGAAVITISTALAVASFGATSLLSGLGIYIGASVLIKAVTIASGAIGLGLMSGGLALAHDRALKNVTKASTLFWQPKPTPTASSFEQVNIAQITPALP